MFLIGTRSFSEAVTVRGGGAMVRYREFFSYCAAQADRVRESHNLFEIIEPAGGTGLFVRLIIPKRCFMAAGDVYSIGRAARG